MNETQGYIERRLQLAGSSDPGLLFPIETIAAVHRHSRGIPRLINTICENGLIAAYAKQTPSVTPAMIDVIASDFRLGVHTRPGKKNSAPDEIDLQKVAKKLLELYASLQADQSREEELTSRLTMRITEQ